MLFRLQRRIFKAIRDKDTARARRLQKLVLSSYAARMLAIRQVSQLNTGKRGASAPVRGGASHQILPSRTERPALAHDTNAESVPAKIDGVKSINFKQRFELETILQENFKDWQHQGLREIPIPKKDGTKRILKVPTMADRDGERSSQART